jgi:Family of unknown function (DUF6483)
MFRRDYILRMIEQLAQVLSRTRQQITARQFDDAGDDLDQAFRELTGLDAKAAVDLSETELLARLTLDAPTLVVHEKTLVITALLEQAGRLRAEQGHPDEAVKYRLKALNLLLTLKLQDYDQEFPEFVPKIDQLRDDLRDTALPLETLAALWRYYERIGAFARAEDSLALLLEAQPDNAALRHEARAFYERLLLQSDSALQSGNLPRDEVQSALAALAA